MAGKKGRKKFSVFDAKLIEKLDTMKSSRYWSLWATATLIGALLSGAILIRSIAPQGLIKPPVALESDSPASHASSVK